MVTSRDVAKLAKVSQATVSRVFSNSDLVSDKTKERVLAAAEELNYSPNLAARSLKSNRSHTIGMIISSYDSIFYSAVTRRLEKRLKQSNYRLLTTFSSEDPKTEFECFQSLLASRVDGIIFTPVSMETEHLLEIRNDFDFSLLQLYRDADQNIGALTIDDSYGTYLATKVLLENGHRRILLIDYRTSVPTHRSEGYIQAFRELDEPIDEMMFFHFNPDPESDEFALLEQKIHNVEPTAIIAVTANTGLHVLKYCKQNGLRIPNDLSLVVYDDSSWAQINDISVIAHPYDLIANTIAEMILAQIDQHASSNSRHMIKPFLIERKSIASHTK